MKVVAAAIGLMLAADPAAPKMEVVDVDFCRLAAAPATYEGRLVRTRAISTGSLDNIPVLAGACDGSDVSIVVGNDLVKGARQALYDWRAPPSVSGGAFYIVVTMTALVRREAKRQGWGIDDSGFHLLPTTVAEIEAKKVSTAELQADTANLQVKVERLFTKQEEWSRQHPSENPSAAQLQEWLSGGAQITPTPHPPPPPSPPSPAGSAPLP